MIGAALMAREAVGGVSGRLIVCPTPIGNLEDITLRVLAALRDGGRGRVRGHAPDAACCWSATASRRSSCPYHEHNERERTPDLVARMRDGAVVALVSDAGMPLVSDPGYVLVQGCVAAGLEVEVLPGPSAALAALVASALPAGRVALRRLPAAQAGGAGRGVRGRAETAGRVRVAAAGGGVAGGAGGASIRRGPSRSAGS